MSIITVRIDDDLKKKMESFKHLNWSAIIRQAIIKTIQNEQENNRAKAILLNEKVRKSISKKVNSVEIIREFRENRYGPKKIPKISDKEE